jgi:hypothetical protein
MRLAFRPVAVPLNQAGDQSADPILWGTRHKIGVWGPRPQRVQGGALALFA